MLAVMDGEPLEEARRRMALNAELHAEGRYRDAPPSEWPQLEFKWDLSPEGQRQALDGVTSSDFQQRFPIGLRLGWVDFAEFDAKLCHHSRRDDGEALEPRM